MQRPNLLSGVSLLLLLLLCSWQQGHSQQATATPMAEAPTSWQSLDLLLTQLEQLTSQSEQELQKLSQELLEAQKASSEALEALQRSEASRLSLESSLQSLESTLRQYEQSTRRWKLLSASEAVAVLGLLIFIVLK